MPMAGAAEWGWVLRINARDRLDIQLAGFPGPLGVALGVVSDIAATNVIPGYAKGGKIRNTKMGKLEECYSEEQEQRLLVDRSLMKPAGLLPEPMEWA
jgi:hypothetical protein